MVRSVEKSPDARPRGGQRGGLRGGQRGGLRERKKLAVRHALSSAAIRLAVQRGLDNVTVEDITAEAGVSLRTFGNYFSSKYEAICAIGTDRARRMGAELLARPAGEPLWDALVLAVLAHYEGADEAPDKEWLAGLRLVLAAPAIRGEYLKVTAEMQRSLASAIAVRTGVAAEQDMYPDLLAGAVTAAAQVALGRWGAADPPVPLRPLLRRALDRLATACSGGAGRYLTEEEFKALVRPAIFGPNGPLCEPPGTSRTLSRGMSPVLASPRVAATLLGSASRAASAAPPRDSPTCPARPFCSHQPHPRTMDVTLSWLQPAGCCSHAVGFTAGEAGWGKPPAGSRRPLPAGRAGVAGWRGWLAGLAGTV